MSDLSPSAFMVCGFGFLNLELVLEFNSRSFLVCGSGLKICGFEHRSYTIVPLSRRCSSSRRFPRRSGGGGGGGGGSAKTERWW